MARVLSHPEPRRLLVILAAVAVAVGLGPAVFGRQGPPARLPAAFIDIVALDRGGRHVDNLSESELAVFVDGVRRAVESVRRVSRGPGAVADAASRSAAGVAAAAEAERTVLVVIDKGSILRGDEREAVAAAGLFLDRLGLDDRIAVLAVPLESDARVSLTSERPEVRAALSRVTGQLAPAPMNARADMLPPLPPDQARMTGLETNQPIEVDPAAAASPGAREVRAGRGSLAALLRVFSTIRDIPGRKAVAVFSAGLPDSAGGLVDEAAHAAASARAVIYGFGLHPSSGGDAASGLSLRPLERLAAATGGMFVALGRKPEHAIDRAAIELGACYALSVQLAGLDVRSGRHDLRVETTRKGVTLRAAAWLSAAAAADDRLLDPANAVAPAEPPATGRGVEVRPSAARSADPDLQVALGRLFDYADGYERRYSMLVAEEDYKQSASSSAVRLRSDVLLVRSGADGEWVSFRDVFEVDGRPVRDREERLRRLFLDATPAAIARLNSISQESARYNVGSVQRTVNVPLLPFRFLRPSNRARFEYELDGREEAGGVPVWRVRYTERASPTLVADQWYRDVPVAGWFLVDTVTGAVVETRMTARQEGARAEIAVRYRRDPLLGLWVPAEMKESYWQPEAPVSGRPGALSRLVLDGKATYSNYRRFQVTTEATIAPPK